MSCRSANSIDPAKPAPSMTPIGNFSDVDLWQNSRDRRAPIGLRRWYSGAVGILANARFAKRDISDSSILEQRGLDQFLRLALHRSSRLFR